MMEFPSEDDDDGGGGIPLGTPGPLPCDCTNYNHHPSLRCVGCSTCYFKAIEVFNSEQRDEKKEQRLEYDHDDDVMGPDFGSLRWFCPACERRLLSNEQPCLLKNFQYSSKNSKPNDGNTVVEALQDEGRFEKN